jgi:type I restriction enzyme S subunit
VQSSKYEFRPGDVLYGKLRPYLDKAVLATDHGICTTELLVLRRKQGVDPRFLIGLVHSPDFVAHAIEGTTPSQHPRTSWSHISEFRLPAFTPSEMSSIATVIWKVHHALLANEAALDRCSALKRATTQAVFAKGLRGEQQQITEIGRLPQGWAVVPLGSLGRVGNGSTPKRTTLSYWQGGSTPWLNSSRMYDREIMSSDQCVTDLALRECHLPIVKPGAVLMAITGQGKTLGHCAVLHVPAAVSQHVAYIQLNATVAVPSYVRGYLETQYEALRKIASGGGSTKGALTCAYLRSVPIPLPNQDEQEEIAALLDAIDRKVNACRRKAAAIEGLFKALMRDLYAGTMCASGLYSAATAAAAAPAEGTL